MENINELIEQLLITNHLLMTQLNSKNKSKISNRMINHSQPSVDSYIGDCCNLDRALVISPEDLYCAYQLYCSQSNLYSVSKNLFGRILTAKGYALFKRGGKRFRIGISLKPNA